MGQPTPNAAATSAPAGWSARHEQRRLLDLFGTLDWDPDVDDKAERSRYAAPIPDQR